MGATRFKDDNLGYPNSIVHNFCLQLVPSGCLMVTGFSDGVLRILSHSNQKLEVVEAFKPHAMSICDVVIGGDLLLTASEDATIFLFRIRKGFELSAIGFCELESSPSCLCWNSGASFLVMLRNFSNFKKIYLYRRWVAMTEKF